MVNNGVNAKGEENGVPHYYKGRQTNSNQDGSSDKGRKIRILIVPGYQKIRLPERNN